MDRALYDEKKILIRKPQLHVHVHDNAFKEFVELPDGRKRFFKDLESHQDELIEDSTKILIVEEIYQTFLPILGTKLPTSSDLFVMYGKLIVNKHGSQKSWFNLRYAKFLLHQFFPGFLKNGFLPLFSI